jgi:hypothetical protein
MGSKEGLTLSISTFEVVPGSVHEDRKKPRMDHLLWLLQRYLVRRLWLIKGREHA